MTRSRFPLHYLLALSLTALAVIFLGCMSLSIGGRTITPPSQADGDLLTQQGKVEKLTTGGELEIFYPIPYASPPNLELTSDSPLGDIASIDLLEQREDRFRIRNSRLLCGTVSWKARGVRRPLAQPVLAPPPPLPDRPIPVENPQK